MRPANSLCSDPSGRRLLVALAVTIAGAACAGEVSVVQVDPSLVSTQVATPVTVYGSGFEVEYLPLTNGIVGDFRVFVGETELLDPVWIDTTRIDATVPSGVAPGECYAVTVRMEHREQDASLGSALCVTSADLSSAGD